MSVNMKSNKKRILVVDDLPSDTKLLKRYLEGTNEYVVREENDVQAAFSTAQEFRPHLILLDVLMPGMNGGELAARLEGDPNLNTVPIVFLTSTVTKEQVGLCGGQIGKYPFLAKPIVLAEVAACLKEHLGE